MKPVLFCYFCLDRPPGPPRQICPCPKSSPDYPSLHRLTLFPHRDPPAVWSSRPQRPSDSRLPLDSVSPQTLPRIPTPARTVPPSSRRSYPRLEPFPQPPESSSETSDATLLLRGHQILDSPPLSPVPLRDPCRRHPRHPTYPRLPSPARDFLLSRDYRPRRLTRPQAPTLRT